MSLVREIPLREERNFAVPEVFDARVVPRNPLLIGILAIVLDRYLVAQKYVRQGLEAMRVIARDPNTDRVIVADVDTEGIVALAV